MRGLPVYVGFQRRLQEIVGLQAEYILLIKENSHFFQKTFKNYLFMSANNLLNFKDDYDIILSERFYLK